MPRFEVIFRQEVIEDHRFVIECDNEELLLSELSKAEDKARKMGFDHLDDLHVLLEQSPLNVVEIQEHYMEDWELPEYLSHEELG